MKIKKLFSTPKKAALTVGATAFSLCFIGAASVFSVFAIAESTSIGEEAAISNAYKAAGVNAEEVETVDADFEFKDGKFVYDVEFECKGKKYKYKIGSSNGAVVKGENPDLGEITEDIISLDEAKEIAINHAGFTAENVTFTKAKLDKDDGVLQYEIKFFTEENRYEYEINALDGAILDTEIKESGNDISLDPNVEYLTVEAAQAKALEAANVTEVTFTKSKLCKDDGTFVYKIEFVTETHEYEYEIDAVSGEVVESEVEAIEDEPVADTTISAEEAKNAAFAHAGITDIENVTEVEFELNEGKNGACYEFEFVYNGKEYEYKISAYSGNIVKTSTEASDKDVVVADFIGIDAAKAKALEAAGFTADDVAELEAELDKKYGSFVYEVEFETADGTSYSYEIDAVSGEVVDSKTGTPDCDDFVATVTEEEAKQIAIDFANTFIAEQYPDAAIIDETNVVEIELDGKKYEVEFETELGEFEIKVDATTGEIKGKEFDKEDDFDGKGNGKFEDDVIDDDVVADDDDDTNNGVCDGTGAGTGSGNGKGDGTGKVEGTEIGKNSVKLTIDEAKAIALADAGIEGEAVFTKAKLEKEDGVSVYEIEFTYNEVEYEYEINASSGKVMECELDD